MAKKHLKRIAAPSTWPVERKSGKFIARPKGSFRLDAGLPLITVLKDVLRLVSTRKEGKLILNRKDILVNGKRQKDEKFMIGLMDVLTVKELGRHFRVLFDKNGMLRLVPVSESEAALKPCKIVGKRSIGKGRVQLSLHDGRTFLGTDAHKTGDTIMLALQKNEVAAHLSLETGCQAYLTGGHSVGCTGVIERISGDKVTVKVADNVVEAAKRFVFVIGKDKPAVNVAV